MSPISTQRERSQASIVLRPLLAGCLLNMTVVVIVAVYWRELRALSWYWQAELVIVYLALYAWTRSLSGSRELSRAKTLVDQDKYAEAMEAIEAVLRRTPHSAEAHYLKGVYMLGLGRAGEAERAWQEAVDRDPTHWAGAAMLSSLYLQRGNAVKAAEYYIEARDRGARDPDFRKNAEAVKHALTMAGREAEQRQDFRSALKHADMHVRIEPDHAIAYAWRGLQHLRLGEFEAAIEDAKRCLELDPHYDQASKLLRDAEEQHRQLGPSRVPGKPVCSGGDDTHGKTDEGISRRETAIPHKLNPTLSVHRSKVHDDGGDETYLWRIGDLAFDRFLVRRIVSGGMGHIYCCWDQKTVGPVALKSIKLDAASVGYDLQTAFRTEAEQWFRLGKHRNIVRLLSVEKFAFTHLVLAMEYIAGDPEVGPTLHDHLQAKRKLPVSEAVRIAVAICHAQEFAHRSAQLVHRDLKPHNIFITSSGQVKVGDFGLAAPQGSVPDVVAGSRPYMAPEQFDENEPLSVAMDVYATGVILYEALCGVRPIPPDGTTPGDDIGWIYHHGNTAPLPLSGHRPDVPLGLSEIVLKCLAKEPGQRFQSFAELHEALLPYAPDTSDDHACPDTLAAGSSPAFDAFGDGVSADALGYPEEALASYRKAVACEPFKSQRSEAWCNMGKVLAALGRVSEGLSSYERALVINPEDPHALLGKANLLSGMGKSDEALEGAEKLVGLKPDWADAHACTAVVLEKAGRIKEAESAADKASSLDPNHPHPYVLNVRGRCAIAKGDYQEAVNHLKAAIRTKEDFADAHNNLAHALAALSLSDDRHRHSLLAEALEAAKRAAEIKPNNPEYRANLGIAYGKLERYEEAIEHLTEAIRMEPGNATAHLCLAHAYYAIGDYARAEEYGQRAEGLGEPEGKGVVEMAKQHRRGRTPAPQLPTGRPPLKPRRPNERAAGLTSPNEAETLIKGAGPSRISPDPNVTFVKPPARKREVTDVGHEGACPNCGKLVSSGVNFCTDCGAKVR